MFGLRVIQCNLNHCRGAQDLLLQCLAEWSIALAVVAEPYRVPDHPRWFGDDGDSVAIYWGGGEGDPPCSLLERGQGFVAVQWGSLVVVGCYVSPNCTLAVFEGYLDEVRDCVRRYLPRPVIVLGDFNARSRAWGDARDDIRGETVLEWSAGLDLRLQNRGSVSTCVRWQGESIVDLTWATPAAARIVSGWRVAEEAETLSDHRHIIFDVAIHPPGSDSRRRRSSPPRRWSVKRLDRDALETAAIVAAWPETDDQILPDPEEEAAWFRETMTSICDVSMPRTRPSKRRGAYWWSEELARLREASMRARRQYTRARRRRRATAEETARAYEAYRSASTAFRTAIADAKARSWEELLEGLNRDPWGRPYKMVLGKLRPWVPPLTETLDPDLRERVIDTLFPRVQGSPSGSPPLQSESGDFSPDEQGVTPEELDRAVRRLRARNTAPGPDGIPGRALVLALEAGLGDRLRRLFNSCFRSGVFPSGWKEDGSPAEER